MRTRSRLSVEFEEEKRKEVATNNTKKIFESRKLHRVCFIRVGL